MDSTIVRKLAQARTVVTEHQSKIAALEAEIAASPAGQELASNKIYLKIEKETMNIVEDRVRSEALAAYAETGDKTPHPDAKIALSTVLAYEQVDALGYARAHLPQALKLDIKAFENAAKVLGLDFVTITKEPRVKISRDLSAHLDQA